MNGISLQQLSDSLENKITKQSISKYEMGLMKPSVTLLFEISKALSVKPDYFLKQGILNVGQISFRKKTSLLKTDEESIVEKARDYVERNLELENLLGIQKPFQNPLEGVLITSKEDVRKAAEKLREAWQLGQGPISNLVEMLELKGVKVQLILDSDSFDGLAALGNDKVPIVVINTANRSIERVRFTIIHELAHLLLLLDESIKGQNKSIEEHCHYFSSCFLLPQQSLIEGIGGNKRSYISINELIKVKEQFGISIRAIVHRLRSVEIINSTYYQKWMVYMSKTYGPKHEPGNFNGNEVNESFDILIYRAISEGIISFSKAASIANRSIEEIREGYLSVE